MKEIFNPSLADRGTTRFQEELVQISGIAESEHTRRDFLSTIGFTVAASALSACRAPVQNAVPLLVGSDRLIPGVANWYATTCGGCPASCSLLVKQRDGRPIKIEGNDRSALFGGGTCATGQATVLSLYDSERLAGPIWKGRRVSWQQMDNLVRASLPTPAAGEQIVLLSDTITSPSTLAILDAWRGRYQHFRHVTYNAVSLGAVRAANAESFGRAAIPHYSFEKARMIVGLEADFLGAWLSPVEFAHQYSRARLAGSPCLHVQVESGMSVTGGKADLRIAAAPSEMGVVAVALLYRIAEKARLPGFPKMPDALPNGRLLDQVAEQLWSSRGESLVVSGIQDVAIQTVVNALNSFLGNVGRTLDLTRPSLQRTGDDASMAKLVDEMNRGEIHTLLLYGVNPCYDYSAPELFAAGLSKTSLSISLAGTLDETASLTHAVCPDHHFLEAWGDAEPVDSCLSLRQPLISPLFDTRAAPESLLRWIGDPVSHYDYIRAFWKTQVFPRQRTIKEFEIFWDQTLQSGVVTLPPVHPSGAVDFRGDWIAAANAILEDYRSVQNVSCELHLYESVAQRDGRHANNPWLQELPDPVTSVTWGNFAAVAPALARKLDLKEGDVVSISTGNGTADVPVVIQPGQQERTVSVALGYGREKVGKVGRNVGNNFYHLTSTSHGHRRRSAAITHLGKIGRRESIARAQSHFSMEGRPIALETTFRDLAAQWKSAVEEQPTLWTERPGGEHSWGMTIDLNACTGCSACVVACQAENNVPVVGKDQVERGRIMHWIRIDRYYQGDEDRLLSIHQPMMCQHCGHAPCETVCPVLATTTSSEGINQQVYNRCIGTRYCANNCPYKVRRFNWYNYTGNARFDFNMNSPLGRMVLNPDVVVRSRGVMEKCDLCVQRIQLAKNLALQEKRALKDGEIQTACQQSCPARAIVFGDLKDPQSDISQMQRSQRHYYVLEELGTRPNVAYLKKIRNTLENG